MARSLLMGLTSRLRMSRSTNPATFAIVSTPTTYQAYAGAGYAGDSRCEAADSRMPHYNDGVTHPRISGSQAERGTRSPERTDSVKKRLDARRAWAQARELIAEHRSSLVVGFLLMLVSRAAGFVLPLSSKYLIDTVIGQRRTEMLWPLALITGAATLVQAITSFALSQVVSIAGQRAITTMRKRVQ